jgi:hypothetical protein
LLTASAISRSFHFGLDCLDVAESRVNQRWEEAEQESERSRNGELAEAGSIGMDGDGFRRVRGRGDEIGPRLDQAVDIIALVVELESGGQGVAGTEPALRGARHVPVADPDAGCQNEQCDHEYPDQGRCGDETSIERGQPVNGEGDDDREPEEGGVSLCRGRQPGDSHPGADTTQESAAVFGQVGISSGRKTPENVSLVPGPELSGKVKQGMQHV